MGVELRVIFPDLGQEARRAVAGLHRLLDVATAAAAAAAAGPAGSPQWRLTHLALGSVQAGIAPVIDDSVAKEAFGRIVAGFAQAEEHEGVPAGWDAELTKAARDLLAQCGPDGLLLAYFRDGYQVRSARAGQTARRHLAAGLRSGYRDSIGSIIGQLDTVSVHDRFEARMWPERGGGAVSIRFDADQIDLVKDHLGGRVEASGRIRRDAFGQIQHLTLRSLELLPTFAESPPLSDLVGLDPDFTDGKSAEDYLREIRGQAL